MIVARMRVLFLVPSLGGGGAERVFSTLLRHLDRNRFELHLAVLQGGGAYMGDVPKDVTIHDLRVSRARYALPSVLNLVWRLRPQAMLSTPLNLNLTLILGKPLLPSGTKLLVRESTTASVFLGETKNPKMWTWLYRKLYKKADKIVCLSDWIVDDMVAKLGVPREKMVRIYNPVDINRVLELAEVGGNPYSGPGPHLVAAGRLSREKGFDILLAAMPAVLECLPDSRLTILGDGPLRDDLSNQMHKLGLSPVVNFLGFQQNPWRYLKHADAFVLPSRYEGLSNILLEVLAIGRPVVATDCPGAVREVESCDEEMIVVRPEDHVALAEAIVSVCRRPRREHDHLETVRLRMSKFNLQRIVDEYSALFQQVS